MFQSSRSRIRIGFSIAAVSALLALSTGAVAADTGPGGDGTWTQDGKGADAYGYGGCVVNQDATETCTDVGVNVFVGKMRSTESGVTHANQVCVYIDRYTVDLETGDYLESNQTQGCDVDVPSGTITFGSGLSTVVLASRTISAEQFTCDKESCSDGPNRDVNVSGTWTGFGPIFTSKYRYNSDDGACRYDESGKGSNRDATFAGTIDGIALDQDAYGSIRDGKSTFRSRCIEV
jgi:hypothetical protein